MDPRWVQLQNQPYWVWSKHTQENELERSSRAEGSLRTLFQKTHMNCFCLQSHLTIGEVSREINPYLPRRIRNLYHVLTKENAELVKFHMLKGAKLTQQDKEELTKPHSEPCPNCRCGRFNKTEPTEGDRLALGLSQTSYIERKEIS